MKKKVAEKVLRLRIELIPSQLHGYNLRSDAVGVGKVAWKKLRETAIANQGSACSICGSAEKLRVHEHWRFDEKGKSGTAKLVRLEVICERCHYVHHWGFTQSLMAEGKMRAESVRVLIQHFANVNRCSENDFDEHVKSSEVDWKRRNKLKWRVDWGEFTKLVEGPKRGKTSALAKGSNLKVPCANCANPITVTFPLAHSKNSKRLGIIYACLACKRGGRMELPPGSLRAFIAKGALAIFSADIESAEWKVEVGAS